MKYDKDKIFFKQELVGEDIKQALMKHNHISEGEAERCIEEYGDEIETELDRVICSLQEDWGLQLRTNFCRMEYMIQNRGE